MIFHSTGMCVPASPGVFLPVSLLIVLTVLINVLHVPVQYCNGELMGSAVTRFRGLYT